MTHDLPGAPQQVPRIIQLNAHYEGQRHVFPEHGAGALGMCMAWATLGQFLRLAIFHPAAGFTMAKFWVYFALVGIEHGLASMAQAHEREAQAALARRL